MTEQVHFRAPSKQVEADMRRMFEYVGQPHPYGPPLTIENVFDLIAEKYGAKAARKCKIIVTLH